MKDLAYHYLTVADVARRWQLGARSVRDMVHDGKLPAVHRGGEYLIRAEDMWSCEQGPFPRGAAHSRQLDPLMTKCDVAFSIRCSVKQVERWIEAGLPTRNVGVNVLIDEEAARVWLRACRGLELPPFVAPPKRRREADLRRRRRRSG